MANRFDEMTKNAAIQRLDGALQGASGAMTQFTKLVGDANAHWTAYESLNPTQDELADTAAAYSERAAQFVESHKAPLAAALDLIAARLVDGDGDPLTRQALLDMLAAEE